jgi:hypothetical protein
MSEAPPTLDDLRAALADAEDEFERCQYIDHWPSALACRDRWRQRIDRLTIKIAELEESEDRQARPAPLWPAGQGEGD